MKFYDAEERENLSSHREEQRKHRITRDRLRMSERRNAELEAKLRHLRADRSNGA